MGRAQALAQGAQGRSTPADTSFSKWGVAAALKRVRKDPTACHQLLRAGGRTGWRPRLGYMDDDVLMGHEMMVVASDGKSDSVSAALVRGPPLYSRGDVTMFRHRQDLGAIGDGCLLR